MIQTWIADVSALLDEDVFRAYYEKLPEFRKEKADKMHFQEDKALSAGVWILLEKMRETYNLGDGAVYNLSHSGCYAMCSIDDSEKPEIKLGCDIEKIREPHMKIAKRFFCESECAYLKKEPGWFYRFWVLKESFMKATRLGMKLGLNTFAFDFDGEGMPILIKKPENIEGEFFFKEYEEDIPYRVAVCATDSEFAERLHVINL